MNIWLVSDTHFGHASAVHVFKRHDGTPLRDFPSVEAMDEHIIERWNSVVKPSDHVYHLGDVAINRRCLPTVGRCNGHKRLVRGNHDIFKTKEYLEYFEEIQGMRVLDNILFTHIPVHPDCLGRFSANVHGHLHHQPDQIGWMYFNISIEMLDDYTPMSLDHIKAMTGCK